MNILANNAGGAADFAISPWAQFGLGGAVIGALFATLLFFIRQHYAERKEWRDDIKDIAAKHDETAKQVTDKFVSLHEKTLDAVRK